MKTSKIVAILLVLSFGILGADCSSLQKKLEADVWLVDPSDGTIYRNRNDDQTEYIFCTDKSAELFACMHKNDVKKWTDVLNARCE